MAEDFDVFELGTVGGFDTDNGLELFTGDEFAKDAFVHGCLCGSSRVTLSKEIKREFVFIVILFGESS